MPLNWELFREFFSDNALQTANHQRSMVSLSTRICTLFWAPGQDLSFVTSPSKGASQGISRQKTFAGRILVERLYQTDGAGI